MRPYMVYAGDAADGAVLVIAHTAKEARALGWPEVRGWCDDAEWIDVRVKWLKEAPWVMREAYHNLIQKDQAHVVQNPTTCARCEFWGGDMDADNVCTTCRDEETGEIAMDCGAQLDATGEKLTIVYH